MAIIKDISDIFESLVTGVAVIIAGGWAYNKFIRNRERYPRASLYHQISEKKLTNRKRLVHLVIEIENIGSVLLSIKSYDIRLNQVNPLNKELEEEVLNNPDPTKNSFELTWPIIFHRLKEFKKEDTTELEPSEKEQLHFDFVIDEEVTTIQIYSYFRNHSKKEKEIGWHLTSFHDLGQKRVEE